MAVGKIVTSLFLYALSYSAQALLRKDTKQPQVNDDAPSTTSTRGSMVPRLLGRKRLGAVIAAVGDRQTTKEKVDTGGGKGGSGSGTKVTVFLESAVHLLAVGPATKLHKIWQSGTNILKDVGTITSTSHPSGSSVDLGGEVGVFRIYWGDAGQPVNTYVSSEEGLGISTAFPGICYVVWEPKYLGQSPRWPVLDYDLEVRPENTPTGATYGVWMEDDIVNPGDPEEYTKPGGANPAALLYNILLSGYPKGLEFSESLFDITALNLIGVELSDQTDKERLPVHILMKDGESYKSTLAGLLMDMGIMMYWDNTQGKYSFRLLREDLSTPDEIDELILGKDLPESITPHAVLAPNRTVYNYTDSQRNYKESTVVWSNDDQAALGVGGPLDKKNFMSSVGDEYTATSVSERRFREDGARGEIITLQGTRTLLNILPGTRVKFPFDDFPYYIISTELKQTDNQSTITALKDFYTAPGSDLEGIPTEGLPSTYDPVADEEFRFIEIPRMYIKDQEGILPLRIRGAAYMAFAQMYLSLDDSSYSLSGTDDSLVSGGTLTTDMSAFSNGRVEEGPVINILGPDISSAIDNLTGNETSWRAGTQFCVINEEIMSIRNLTVISPTQVRLDGLLRGRFGTLVKAHAIGDVAYIGILENVDAITSSSLLVANSDLYMKSVPGTHSELIDIGSVTAYSETYNGGGRKPIAVVNPRNTVTGWETYTTGVDLPLLWRYRTSGSNVNGAGYLQAGTPYNQDANESQFLLQVYTVGGSPTQLFSLVVDDPNYTIPAATTAGWTDATIDVRITALIGNLVSERVDTTFTKV